MVDQIEEQSSGDFANFSIVQKFEEEKTMKDTDLGQGAIVRCH